MKQTSGLVKRFRKGHQEILNSIDEIQLVSRSYLQARTRLNEFFEILSSHLRRQDETFFRALFEVCGDDHESLKMLEFLAHDLKELQIETLTFFDRYSAGVGEVVARNFAKDFFAFAKLIVNRLDAEEEYLFPLLQKVAYDRVEEDEM